MLTSLLARHAAHGDRDVDRYAAWAGALDQFRAAWELGGRPAPAQLQDYLRAVPESQQPEAWQDLVAEHLRLAWQSATHTELESYLATIAHRWPELASATGVPVDLIEDELLVRYQRPHGDLPPAELYARRFAACRGLEAALARRFACGGRFVKLRRRSVGPFGAVWEAHDRLLRARVALKDPPAAPGTPPAALQRLVAEARLTAALDHPQIVRLQTIAAENGDAPVFMMRFIEGDSLGRHLQAIFRAAPEFASREKRRRQHDFLRAFVAITAGIAHAHERGVLHRDLKPGNVLVEHSGNPVIIDWGMAAPLADGNHASAELAGTPEYMAPEQIEGRADARTDVFGLGAILYEILCGRAPRAWTGAGRPADWRERVRTAPIPPPQHEHVAVAPPLAAICLKALAPDPAQRFASAAELGAEVQRWLDDNGPRRQSGGHLWRWLRSPRAK